MSSETDTQRLALVGVGPNSRSLKFLNNKNNIADKRLQKQISSIERQKTQQLNVIEHNKIDAKHFLKHVRNLEQDSQEVQTYLRNQKLLMRGSIISNTSELVTTTSETFVTICDETDRLLNKDDAISVTPPPKRRHDRDRRRRKVRLAQTAPAHMAHPLGNRQHSTIRKHIKSGPETEAEKKKMMNVDRKRSMFIQLSGAGTRREVTSDDDTPRYKANLPKPSPRTMLDVMIGLNAFSYVPSPTIPRDDIRSDTRSSFLESDSMYDSSENIAKKFINNWRKRVASRKQSIFQKLEDPFLGKPTTFRSDSIATSVIPEETSQQSLFRRRKSKWTMRHSMRQPTLPAIDDDDERMEHFLQYIRAAKEKEKHDTYPVCLTSSQDKTAMRRKSFVMWLQERKEHERKNLDSSDDEDEDEDELMYKGISLQPRDDDFKPTEIGDLMKTILKIKTRFRDPLDARVRRFLKEIDKLKLQDNFAQTLTDKERKRRWIALTKGIDAALADSSDDDDDYYNTV